MELGGDADEDESLGAVLVTGEVDAPEALLAGIDQTDQLDALLAAPPGSKELDELLASLPDGKALDELLAGFDLPE